MPDEMENNYLYNDKGNYVAGIHLIIDAYGVNGLENYERIEKILQEAATKAKATILNTFTRIFEPQGSTTAVICSESHCTGHFWPEQKYAAFDIFLCGNTDPYAAAKHIINMIDAKHIETKCIKRGEYILDNF